MIRKFLKQYFPGIAARRQAYLEAIASCKAQVIRTGETDKGLTLWVCQIIHPTHGVMGQHVQVSRAWRQAASNLKRMVRHVG